MLEGLIGQSIYTVLASKDGMQLVSQTMFLDNGEPEFSLWVKQGSVMTEVFSIDEAADLME